MAFWTRWCALIVNREKTPLDPLADVVLRGEVGELLPALVDALASE